jgi:pectinesterase inhibitor-like protein
MPRLATSHAIVAIAVLVLVSTVITSFPAAVMADANFIAKVCRSIKVSTSHCVEVLSTDPRSFKASRFEDLVSIGLDIATSTRTDVAKGIDGEARKHDKRSPLGQALTDCANYYGYAVNPLENARESLSNRSYLQAQAEAAEAEDAAEKCEQGFSRRNLTSVVVTLDEKMRQRCELAYDLIGLLIS